MGKDIHGKAIYDFYRGITSKPLTLHNSYGDPEEMPVEVFFREEEDLSTIEHLALIECQGTVLDLGAGAGAHSLILQARDFDVTALENSAGCVQVLRQSGLNKVVDSYYQKHHHKYDTLLVLMNGLGLAGNLSRVPSFLKTCMNLLKPGGQILVDSSDIRYLYDDGLPYPTGYYGEIQYQYEYDGQKGEWFDWLYLDQTELRRITDHLKLQLEILHTDENDQYLARITG